MQVIRVILVSAVVGVLVGAAVAYVEVRPGAVVSAATRVRSAEEVATPAPNEPRLEVKESTYNFGEMQRGTSKSHEFTFRNVGRAPLTLSVASTTCKCTVGNVTGEPVMPGNSVNVKLEWSAIVSAGPFRQTATISTNDPLRSRVELMVEGTVKEATGLLPADFVFDKVTAGHEKSAEIFVMALVQDKLEVGEPTLSNEETRKFFDIRVEPVDRASLPNKEAKEGVRVTVTAKPGLPLGRFDQILTLPTNIPDAETLKIPVIGRVVGNISVHGRLWNEEQGVLRIGHVKSADGVRVPLNIVIRGEGAENVTLSVASCDPPEMVATLGEPKRLKETLVHIPLVIEIPPGTPPMARLDTEQSDEGRVVIKTTDADVDQMVLGVRFAVER
jgi:hypothetical protein